MKLYLPLFSIVIVMAVVILTGCGNKSVAPKTPSPGANAPAGPSSPPKSPQEQVDRYKKMQEQSRGAAAPPSVAP